VRRCAPAAARPSLLPHSLAAIRGDPRLLSPAARSRSRCADDGTPSFITGAFSGFDRPHRALKVETECGNSPDREYWKALLNKQSSVRAVPRPLGDEWFVERVYD